MSSVLRSPPGRLVLPRGGWTLALLLAGWATLALPTLADLAREVWSTDEQGHGPVIGIVSLWLMWRQRHALAATPVRPANLGGSLVFMAALLLHLLGRTQDIVQAEVLGVLLVPVALVLLLRGAQALRLVAFPLAFLVFMVPFPGALVQAVTIPLKSAVSMVAEALMHLAGYPVARSGVVLMVGQYQLLVADACAGLNSMFTLEALGLLYMNLMGYTSRLRNVLLALLIIPISFTANVVRVVVLVLVTFHLGDAAGQGFVHGFAGMVLFLVALGLMLLVDRGLGRIAGLDARRAAPAGAGA